VVIEVKCVSLCVWVFKSKNGKWVFTLLREVLLIEVLEQERKLPVDLGIQRCEKSWLDPKEHQNRSWATQKTKNTVLMMSCHQRQRFFFGFFLN
jgi:hypothetical protein